MKKHITFIGYIFLLLLSCSAFGQAVPPLNTRIDREIPSLQYPECFYTVSVSIYAQGKDMILFLDEVENKFSVCECYFAYALAFIEGHQVFMSDKKRTLAEVLDYITKITHTQAKIIY